MIVDVCTIPSILVPAGAQPFDIEQAVNNKVAIWNQLRPILGNVQRGVPNNVRASDFDFESVALHELGHSIGLAQVSAASESLRLGTNRNFTKVTDGANNGFDFDVGNDGFRDTLDDFRGDRRPTRR